MKQIFSILLFTLMSATTAMAQDISTEQLQKAQNGDAQAQYEVGKHFYKAKDYTKAVE